MPPPAHLIIRHRSAPARLRSGANIDDALHFLRLHPDIGIRYLTPKAAPAPTSAAALTFLLMPTSHLTDGQTFLDMTGRVTYNRQRALPSWRPHFSLNNLC